MSKLVVLDGRRTEPRRSIRPSRFTHLVPIADGRSVAWNSLSGDLALWDRDEAAAYERLRSGDDTAGDDRYLDKLSQNRHVVDKALDEVEIVRSLYDRDRYGHRNPRRRGHWPPSRI